MGIRESGFAVSTKVRNFVYLLLLGFFTVNVWDYGFAQNVVQSSEKLSAPYITYAADVENPSKALGTNVKVVFCFRNTSSIAYLNQICPPEGFSQTITKVRWKLPEGLKFVGLQFNPGLNPGGGTGFSCTSDSGFNQNITENGHALIFSGFNCSIDAAVFETVFAMNAYVAVSEKSKVPTLRTMTATITLGNGRQLEATMSPNFSYGPNYPHGLPCLAIVVVGSHYCYIPNP